MEHSTRHNAVQECPFTRQISTTLRKERIKINIRSSELRFCNSKLSSMKFTWMSELGLYKRLSGAVVQLHRYLQNDTVSYSYVMDILNE